MRHLAEALVGRAFLDARLQRRNTVIDTGSAGRGFERLGGEFRW